MSLTKSMPFHKRTLGKANLFACRYGAYWLLVILFGLGVASCAYFTDDSLADRSFLTQSPCAPPCWHRLELDKSNENDVYTTLNKLSFVDQTTIAEGKVTWLTYENAKGIFYGCLHPDDRRCGGVILSGDRLKQMWMSVSYELTFEMVVQSLGIPDYVSYVPRGPATGRAGRECNISFYWPKRLILVTGRQATVCPTLDAVKAGESINPAIRVTTITYMVQEAFKAGAEVGWPYAPWPGFAQ